MDIGDEISELLEFDAGDGYVVSFYLDVDGSRFPRKQDLEVEYNAVSRDVEKKWLQGNRIDNHKKRSISKDLENIWRFINYEMDREKTRGVAIFACAEKGLWKIFSLPVSFPSTAAIKHEPEVGILKAVADQYHRYCAVIVDRRKARIFSVYMGKIEESLGVFEDNVPDKVRVGEWASLRQKRIEKHIEDHVMRHLKITAKKTLIFFKARSFDHLLIGGAKEIIPQFHQVLHPYLRERTAGRFIADPDTSLNKILEKSLVCEREVDKKLEAELIERLENRESPVQTGVLGVEKTLDALMRGQVYQLVIPENLTIKGKVCEEKHYISTAHDVCPLCGRRLAESDDILKEAIRMAAMKKVNLIPLRYHPEFAEKYQVGAILRYAA